MFAPRDEIVASRADAVEERFPRIRAGDERRSFFFSGARDD
jgi:hypothetical protein